MMEMFANRFPKIAEDETRCIILTEHNKLPKGNYYFTESFCNDNSCDCRRAFINVIYNKKIIATIGFGWEDIKFYENFLIDKKLAKDMKGPILEIGGIRTEYSNDVLELFKEFLINDSIFIERLKKHYIMFKDSLEDVSKKKLIKLSKNELCHCGSNIKYKKCCLNKDIKETGKMKKVIQTKFYI